MILPVPFSDDLDPVKGLYGIVEHCKTSLTRFTVPVDTFVQCVEMFTVVVEPDAQMRMAHARLAKVTVDPGSYNASRTSMDLPISQLVLQTADSARGPVVKLPTMGGSVPLYMIEEILHAPTISVPIANHDNNQHSYNENLRVRNLWDGIELMAALLAM